MIIVETPRLILRHFTEDDAAAFLPLTTDPLVTRYTGDQGGKTLEEARQGLLQRPIADYQKHGYGRWACVWKENQQVIGFAGPKFLEELKEIDLGYRFLSGYWGKGLATEASRAVLDVCFSRLQLEKILGLVMPENTASVRVLEKLGFYYVGMMEYWDKPTARYELSRGEWYKKRSNHGGTEDTEKTRKE